MGKIHSVVFLRFILFIGSIFPFNQYRQTEIQRNDKYPKFETKDCNFRLLRAKHFFPKSI